MSVIVDLETLLAQAGERGIHPAVVEFGGPMSAATARRLGCDAEITRVITDPDGMPLDVGLCDHHHRVVHHHGWDVSIAADGRPEFRPPAWIDPDQQPRRNSRPRYHERAGPTQGANSVGPSVGGVCPSGT